MIFGEILKEARKNGILIIPSASIPFTWIMKKGQKTASFAVHERTTVYEISYKHKTYKDFQPVIKMMNPTGEIEITHFENNGVEVITSGSYVEIKFSSKPDDSVIKELNEKRLCWHHIDKKWFKSDKDYSIRKWAIDRFINN